LSLILKQKYITITREIDGIEQKIIEKEQYLSLYTTKIVTPLNTFQLEDVLDVSFRKTTNKFWTLYLHTKQGVFPFYVSTHPGELIEAIQRLK
jgi:hypothetical protein